MKVFIRNNFVMGLRTLAVVFLCIGVVLGHVSSYFNDHYDNIAIHSTGTVLAFSETKCFSKYGSRIHPIANISLQYEGANYSFWTTCENSFLNKNITSLESGIGIKFLLNENNMPYKFTLEKNAFFQQKSLFSTSGFFIGAIFLFLISFASDAKKVFYSKVRTTQPTSKYDNIDGSSSTVKSNRGNFQFALLFILVIAFIYVYSLL